MLNHHQLPLPAHVPADALRPATCIAFTEGPAVAADGTLYFADIIGNRILQLAPDGTRSVFREPSHRTNGQTFDRAGRLWHCEGSEFGPGGGRRVTRTDLRTGQYTVVTERYDGARYNSPNDICCDHLGRMYFSDPCYGDRSAMETEIEGVYRIDTSGQVTRILAQPVIQRPNGLAVTADGRRLYVVDSAHDVGGNRKIWAFDLDAQGQPSNQRVVYDFAPGRGGDGMRLDVEGTLYVAAGVSRPRGPHETADVPAGIYVISPDGQMRGRIPIPEDLVTNLAFGGSDGRTLYVTAGKTVFSVRMPVAGYIV